MTFSPESLRHAELFQHLDPDHIARLVEIARAQHLESGESLFQLGEAAESLYVVTSGAVDICCPVTVGGNLRDIPIETMKPGRTLGWSALVSPYRFTLDARATESTVVAAFTRDALTQLFEKDPRLAHLLTRRIAEIVGLRLLKMQALWAREVQRAVTLKMTARLDRGWQDAEEAAAGAGAPEQET